MPGTLGQDGILRRVGNPPPPTSAKVPGASDVPVTNAFRPDPNKIR